MLQGLSFDCICLYGAELSLFSTLFAVGENVEMQISSASRRSLERWETK
jgi:hypothetical protein